MSHKRLWVQSKKEFLKKIKGEVDALVGHTTQDLTKYQAEYEKTFLGRWKPSSKKELVGALSESSLVLGGDFHAFNQSQRSHLRLLRETKFNKPVALGLECISSDMQGAVDELLMGGMSIDQLPARIKWAEHWPFPWDNYRPLIEWAVQNNVRMIALGTKKRGSPKRFDSHAVKILKKAFNPSLEVLYILVGELHLAERHLLKGIVRAFKEIKDSAVTVHLDSERLFFKLLEQKMEAKVEVLKKGTNNFCIITSPPWIRWQSYLLYLEQTYDNDLENNEEGFIDLTDHMDRMARILCMDLGLDHHNRDFVVLNSMDRMVTRYVSKMSQRDRAIANWLIDQDRSFFEPKQRFLYMSRLSVNHAAELAGALVYADLAGIKRQFWKFPEDFERQIWWEAVIFLLSKLINHKRKPESLERLKTRLESVKNDPVTKEILLLSIDQRMLELMSTNGQSPRRRKVKPRRHRIYYQSARILGQMMGERMFVQFRRNDFKSQRLMDFLKLHPDDPDFKDTYYQVNSRR